MQVDFVGEEFDGRPEEETVMYNLVGHELAKLIEECDGLAGNVLGLRAEGEDEDFLRRFYEKAIRMTVQRFRDVGATEQSIRREVQSMMLDPMTDWNSSSLPVPDQLWKSNLANSPLDASSSIEVQATSNSCCDSQCFLKKSVR